MRMSKFYACMLVVMLVFMASVAMAGDIKVNVGTEADFTIERDLVIDDIDGVELEYASQSYDIKADILLGDKVRITPKAGLSTSQVDTEIGKTDVELESGIGFNIGVDAQVDLYTNEYATLAAIGGYKFSRVDVDSVQISVIRIDNPIETIFATHEWEIGAKIYKDLSELNENIPVTAYVGVVYSDLLGNLDANLSIANLDVDVEADDNVGIRLGASISPVANWDIAIDACLVDKTAIVASAKYKF